MPVVKTQNNSWLFGAVAGQFDRRVKTVQIGADADLDYKKLENNITKLPWLEDVIINCKYLKLGSGNTGPSKLDCPLSDTQIEQLRDSFPDLRITKNCLVSPEQLVPPKL